MREWLQNNEAGVLAVLVANKRDDPSFIQVCGYVPKNIAISLKMATASRRISQSDAIEEAIKVWLLSQPHENQSSDGGRAADFLKKLATGDSPTDLEIIELAHDWDMTAEDLIALRDKVTKKNGNHTNR